LLFTSLPYMTDAGSACGEDSVNGPNGTLDGVSIVEGHEMAESITDPLTTGNEALAKEGSLSAAWTSEDSGVS
jgi:hypothetical protein